MPACCGRSTTSGQPTTGAASSATRGRTSAQIDGTTYGLTYTYGDRSGVWYKPAHLEKAGISSRRRPGTSSSPASTSSRPPATRRRSRSAPSTGRTPSGSKRCCCAPPASRPPAKLAAHEIPWTDPAVKGALQKYAEMLNAGCCGDPDDDVRQRLGRRGRPALQGRRRQLPAHRHVDERPRHERLRPDRRRGLLAVPVPRPRDGS